MVRACIIYNKSAYSVHVISQLFCIFLHIEPKLVNHIYASWYFVHITTFFFFLHILILLHMLCICFEYLRLWSHSLMQSMLLQCCIFFAHLVYFFVYAYVMHIIAYNLQSLAFFLRITWTVMHIGYMLAVNIYISDKIGTTAQAAQWY